MRVPRAGVVAATLTGIVWCSRSLLVPGGTRAASTAARLEGTYVRRHRGACGARCSLADEISACGQSQRLQVGGKPMPRGGGSGMRAASLHTRKHCVGTAARSLLGGCGIYMGDGASRVWAKHYACQGWLGSRRIEQGAVPDEYDSRGQQQTGDAMSIGDDTGALEAQSSGGVGAGVLSL